MESDSHFELATSERKLNNFDEKHGERPCFNPPPPPHRSKCIIHPTSCRNLPNVSLGIGSPEVADGIPGQSLQVGGLGGLGRGGDGLGDVVPGDGLARGEAVGELGPGDQLGDGQLEIKCKKLKPACCCRAIRVNFLPMKAEKALAMALINCSERQLIYN